MKFPSLDDTIVAVSSAWEAAPLGIVRLSGNNAHAIASVLGAEGSLSFGRCPCQVACRIAVADAAVLPALLYVFCAPHSYTGQDLVEIHTVGCLPLLRCCTARLIEAGARRALAGEFTARAFLNGKLDRDDIDRVAEQLFSGDDADARQTARATRGDTGRMLESLISALADAAARLEAGIDFVDEEDVRFVTPEELAEVVRQARRELARLAELASGAATARVPHVALVGLPNAGKSTLFNRLLGEQRALVSPVVGTTRDVLASPARIGSLTVMLQDSAGLGSTSDELELAARRATEQAADLADLVVWVHDGRRDWSAGEKVVLSKILAERRVLVLSRMDECRDAPMEPGASFAAVCRVSAATGLGVDELREALAEQVQRLSARDSSSEWSDEALAVAAAALGRADRLLGAGAAGAQSELLVQDLREAWSALERVSEGPQIEAILDRIYRRFCVGK